MPRRRSVQPCLVLGHFGTAKSADLGQVLNQTSHGTACYPLASAAATAAAAAESFATSNFAPLMVIVPLLKGL